MLEIIRAKEADFKEILAVLNHNLLSNKEDPNSLALSKQGFLVHGFNEQDLKQYSENENGLLAAVKFQNKIVGYEIAYIMKPEDKPPLFAKCEFKEAIKNSLLNNKVLFHRHIAKLPDVKGAGTTLMNELIAFGKSKQCNTIICLIAQKPLANLVSKTFHENFAFKEVGTLHDKVEEKHYGVYAKEI